MYFPDGSVYSGQWDDDKKNGVGTYTYVNGDTYEGQFKDDKRHGDGTYTFKENGTVFKGKWENDQASGGAELIHKNHRYQGGWKTNQLSGPGKYVFDIGCEQHGEYVSIVVEDGEEEEDENKVSISRWKAHHITPITVAQ